MRAILCLSRDQRRQFVLKIHEHAMLCTCRVSDHCRWHHCRQFVAYLIQHLENSRRKGEARVWKLKVKVH
jgi:hypothetical protein